MKKQIVKTILFFFTLTIGLSGCGKYTDGPNFTLKTKEARLCRTWNVVSIGSEVINGYYQLKFTFDKNSNLTIREISTEPGWEYDDAYAGEWRFSQDKKDIELIIDGEISFATIDRLTSDELWFKLDGEQFKLKAE